MEKHYFIPEEVLTVLNTRFHIVIPVFIVLNLIIDVACLLVTIRTKVRAYHSHVYIQMMAILHLLQSFAFLPFVFDNEFCLYNSYTYAFYFTHFGWKVLDMLYTFSIYVLLFLSYDRFLATWYPVQFQKVRQQGITKRVLIVGLFLAASFIPMMYIGEVTIQPNGKWLGLAGTEISDTNWTPIFKPYILIISCILPSILLVGLSIGLLYGIHKKPVNAHEGRRNQFFSALAVLVLNISYSICITPYFTLVMTYTIDKGNCVSNVETELGLLVSHSLFLLWSTVQIIIYFGINKIFLKEVMVALSAVPCIKQNIEYKSDKDCVTSLTTKTKQNVVNVTEPESCEN